MLQHENMWACVMGKNGDEEEEIQEYEVENERDGKVIRCWIPSSSGQTFSIHYGHNGTKISLRWLLLIDGVEVEKLVTSTSECPCKESFVGIMNSSDSVLPFKFSQTQFASEEDSVSGARDLGSIEIRVSQVIRTLVGNARDRQSSTGSEALITQKASEKGKVLAPHSVGLGDAIAVPRKLLNSCTIRPYNPNNPGPYVTFRFQYRPRDFLQAQGIIPVPNPPFELNQDDKDVIDIKEDPGDNEIEDEIEEIERRLQRLREKQARRGSRQASQAPYARKLKREPGASASNSSRRPFAQRDTNEVIDLTSD